MTDYLQMYKIMLLPPSPPPSMSDPVADIRRTGRGSADTEDVSGEEDI